MFLTVAVLSLVCKPGLMAVNWKIHTGPTAASGMAAVTTQKFHVPDLISNNVLPKHSRPGNCSRPAQGLIAAPAETGNAGFILAMRTLEA